MSRFWSPVVHSLTPYVPGEQPKIANLIKLNTNESPYGPSPRVIEAMRAAVQDGLRLYPDVESTPVRQAIATWYGLAPENVFVGNGSDEVLAQVFLALLQHDAPLLFPDITYSFYPVYCRLYGIEYQTIPLAEDFSIRIADYDACPCGAIIFPNPNAPTGRLLSLAEIETLLKAHPDQVVVIDEAYIDFGGESATTLVPRYRNLLVVQTLSKSRSLAGMRVGFAIGDPELIEAITRVKNSFNSYPLDSVAQAAAVAAFKDEAYFRHSCRKVIDSREWLVKEMADLGFDIVPSAANFVFARHPAMDATALAAALRERAILVRHFRLPRVEQYLRISIGTQEQCAHLVQVLKQILK